VVVAENQPPVADAKGPYIGTVNLPVYFDGSGSYDPDGTIINYDWNFGDGKIGSGVNPSHQYEIPNKYIIILTVEDANGQTDIDLTTARIYSKPIANANGPYEGIKDVPIEFLGSVTGGKTPYNWYWDFGDNLYSSSKSPIHNYHQLGTYRIMLKVTDELGVSDTDITEVVIHSAQELVSDAGGPYFGAINQLIYFTGNAIGGVPPYSYEWDLDNDGEYDDAILQSSSKSWSTAGSYKIGLKVRDSIENTDVDTAQVTVNSNPPDKPTITGPNSGKIGEEYEYTFLTIDPNGDQDYYYIER
jgi:PKD repeat protein